MDKSSWAHQYSKIELGNLISKKDYRLELAIKTLQTIVKEAEELDLAELTKILHIAKAALSRIKE